MYYDNRDKVLHYIEYGNDFFPSRDVSLFYVKKHLRYDKEIVLKFLEKDASQIYFVPQELRKDPIIFENFIKNITSSNNITIPLFFAPENIRDNKKIVIMALKKNPRQLHFISNNLKNDVNFIEYLIDNKIIREKDIPPSIQQVLTLYYQTSNIMDDKYKKNEINLNDELVKYIMSFL